jgi:tetratricopeptide (TPR) repeat protein
LAYYYLDDLNTSLSYYQRGLKVKEDVAGKKSKEYANTLNNIGNTYLDLNNLDESLSCLKICLKIYAKIDGKESKDFADTLNNLGNVYTRKK